jgi:hypothetical protein
MTETYLTPEARARVQIDEMLEAAGWMVQDANTVNLAGPTRCPNNSRPRLRRRFPG